MCTLSNFSEKLKNRTTSSFVNLRVLLIMIIIIKTKKNNQIGQEENPWV